MKFEADAAAAAYVSWAQSQISSISADRLEIAKFFFAASSASLAFFIALWQAFHDVKAPLRCLDMASILMLGSSILCSMFIFWPISHDFSQIEDLTAEHRRTLRRIKWEGAVWAILWFSGAVLAVIATLKK